KQSIGTAATWSLAITGSAVAAAKVASVVSGTLPIFSALKSAMVFATVNPFGGILSGLAAVAVTSPQALAGLADFAKAAGSTIATLTSALSNLGQAFGLPNAETMRFLAGAALLFPVARQVSTALFARVHSQKVVPSAN